MENNNNAVEDLFGLIDEDDEQNIEEQDVKEQEDVKTMFESYKEEQEAKIKALQDELNALKNPPKQLSEEELASNAQKEQVLKELGLEGLEEKIKKVDALAQKAEDEAKIEELRQKYTQTQKELLREFPEADFKALGALGTKLEGLADGDVESWRELIRLVNKGKGNNGADINITNSKNATYKSDFDEKIKRGEHISDIDLGKELLSMLGE